MTRKTLMIFIAIVLLFPATIGSSSSPNDREALIAKVKSALIQQINRDRRRHGLQAVQYEPLASAVGDAHCRQALQNGFSGHFGLDGSKPYQRYARAGGYDGMAQNFSFSQWSGYVVDDEFILKQALELHRQMYEERPPFDGHRQNILRPEHNYCGIGLAFDENELRMTEEFIDRYVVLETLPKQTLTLKAALTDTIWITGKTRHGEQVTSVTIFYEPQPQPLSPEEINQTYAYGLPDERRDLFEKLAGGFHYRNGGAGDILLDRSKSRFKFPLRFWKRREGIYTVVVWVKSISLNATFPATNICFFVD
jgi:hypothetical protein